MKRHRGLARLVAVEFRADDGQLACRAAAIPALIAILHRVSLIWKAKLEARFTMNWIKQTTSVPG